MKDRRRPAPHISHERWLVSYADFVTLLFAFFVVLYASAQIDKKKAIQLSGAIEDAFQHLGVFQNELRGQAEIPANGALPAEASPGSGPAQNLSRLPGPAQGQPDKVRKKENLDAIRAELEKALAAEIKRNEVALHMESDGLVLSLREAGFFDSGSATIKPGAEDAFSRVALILQEHPCAVRIEGHTDTVPIHTSQFASNWELSTARATEMVKTLIENHGVSAERLSASGYAEFHPVASNDSAKGRQLNRRVDVVILTTPLPPRVANQPVPAAPAKIPGPAPNLGKAAAENGLGGKT